MNILEIIKEEFESIIKENSNVKINKIITHGGMFHADEILAIQLMRMFYNPQIPVDRIFEVSEEQFDDPSTMVLDIGERLDFDKTNLDHHQDTKNLPASCILVVMWLKKYAGKNLNTPQFSEFMNFVSRIDSGEVGGGGPLDFFNAKIKIFNSIPDGINYAYQLSEAAINNTLNGGDWYDSDEAKKLIEIADNKKAEERKISEKLWNDPTMFHKEEKYAYRKDPDDKKYVGWVEIEKEKPNPIQYTLVGRGRGGYGYSVVSVDSKKYPIEPHETQSYLHGNKFLATYHTFEDAINHMKEMTSGDLSVENIVKEEVRNYLKEEDYYNTKIPDDVKKHSNKYVGRGVIWYGDPDQMIVIHKDFVDGMWGNIYDSEKLKFVEDMIRYSDDYVEFECSYATGGVTDFIDVYEEQKAYHEDRFESDYDGKANPSSLGDEELDNYAGVDELSETELLNWVTWDDVDLYDLLNKNKFFLVFNNKTIDQLKQEVQELRKKTIAETGEDFTEDDLEFFEEFIKAEMQLKGAVDDEVGDIGEFRVTLRDAHHRVFGSIAAGENYICVNLEKDDIRNYEGHYNRVTTKAT